MKAMKRKLLDLEFGYDCSGKRNGFERHFSCLISLGHTDIVEQNVWHPTDENILGDHSI